MKKVILYSLLTVLVITVAVSAQAQKKINRNVYATRVISSSNQDSIIKSGQPDTDTPEPAARGNSCAVKFENYTGYYVNVYVDGHYRGQVAPWGGGTVMVGEGYTTIYCITAGKSLEWKDAGSCKHEYRFRLYP